MLMSMAADNDRADPSAIPVPASGGLELRQDDRSRSVAAACRRHDGARAARLAGALSGEPRHRAEAVCAAEGVDLPH
jgi:hypothetical protein